MRNMFNTDINVPVFRSLSDANQQRVLVIYMIAGELQSHGVEKLTTKEFDELYDKSLCDLQHIVNTIEYRIDMAIREMDEV